jgi:hypothetical protein
MAEFDAPSAKAEGALANAAAAVLERTIFDVAVVQALNPLRPFERVQLLERRVLPEQFNDPRVLSAIFRAPAVLVPLRPDERKAIEEIARALV